MYRGFFHPQLTDKTDNDINAAYDNEWFQMPAQPVTETTNPILFLAYPEIELFWAQFRGLRLGRNPCCIVPILVRLVSTSYLSQGGIEICPRDILKDITLS